MIPKIIHQFWIGDKQPPYKLIDTWKEKNPTWEHILWDEKLLKEYFPDGLGNQFQYDIMPELNGKCDIARYEILVKFGGFFIDADAVCLNTLDDFFVDNDSFSCYENEKERDDLIAVGYLACSQGNELLKTVVKKLGQLTEKDLLIGAHTAWISVGPVFFTEIVKKICYKKLKLYPSHYFIPNHCSGDKYEGKEKIYADQLWGSTPGSEFEGYNFDKLVK